MAKKSQKPAAQTSSSKPPAKKRGRQPSEEAGKYAWYRDVEGFEKCDVIQWWSGINWGEDQTKEKKRKRTKTSEKDV